MSLLLVTLILCRPVGPDDIPPPFTGERADLAAAPIESFLTGAEHNMVKAINARRAEAGLEPLAVHPRLLEAARVHARWMASTGSNVHGRSPGGFNAWGENIAWGQSTSSKAVLTWMNSPGHRANILGRYKYIGVAGYQRPGGPIKWCAQFAR